MNIDLEYSPTEYISYEPVSRIIAVADRKRRSQRKLLFKHDKESEDFHKNDQDFIDNDTEHSEQKAFEPRKLFMKSRCFAKLGGNHSIFTYLDQFLVMLLS